jgi:hypothetical protein
MPVEPAGQHMDQEAADELVDVERHQLVASRALGAVIRPFEGDALAVEGDEPAVGDGDPVGLAGQVGEHSIGSGKRPLGIDHPFDLAQCREVILESCRLGQSSLVSEERKRPAWWAAVSLSSSRRRNRRERTRTDRKKPGRQAIQC